MIVQPELLIDSFHALKMTTKGGDRIFCPVNTQGKLDEITLTLTNEKTGEFKINAPYNISVVLHCDKAVATLIGEKEEPKKKEEK